MPVLTIKKIPDDLYARLKERAAHHRRSLNQEIIVCLDWAVAQPAWEVEAWIGSADRLRSRLALPPVTDARLRREKAAGRP
ncbi:MAG: DNA-binding protein [Planctomycetes bacterium]|jgi:plasmid stability protein|nr:DNA-binding protein [Planctomycetota bacterium]